VEPTVNVGFIYIERSILLSLLSQYCYKLCEICPASPTTRLLPIIHQ
jgi:hypothetical protein